MRNFRIGAVSAAAIALSIFVSSGAAAQTCSTLPPSTTPTVYDIRITLSTVQGTCAAPELKPTKPGYYIRTSNAGDTINWWITNNCTNKASITIGISSFRGTQKDANGKLLPVDHPLIEASSSITVTVTNGQTRKMIGHTKANPNINHYGRICTIYEYDMEEDVPGSGRWKVGDPQIEIPQ